MDIFQVVGAGIIATILILVIKEHRPEIALQMTVLFGVLVFLLMIDKITGVVTILRQLAVKANISMTYMATIFKVIGIAYIAEFGSQICKDAGAGVIAQKIEFAAKILIMIIALPIMVAVLDSVINILP